MDAMGASEAQLVEASGVENPVRVRNEDDTGREAPLLTSEFTPSQVDAMRAEFGAEAVAEMSVKGVVAATGRNQVARLTESP